MNELLRKGEDADRLLLGGRIVEAEEAYRDLVEQAGEQEVADVFILSKCFLGLIVALGRRGEFGGLRRYLETELDDDSVDYVQRLGIFGLKKGMVSKSDFTIFYNLSLFAADSTKHEQLQARLATITLSPWVPTTDEVTVFDSGSAYGTARAKDKSIAPRKPWWKFW